MRPLPVTLVLRSPGGGADQGQYLNWAASFRDTGGRGELCRTVSEWQSCRSRSRPYCEAVMSLRPWRETDVPAKLMAFGDPVV